MSDFKFGPLPSLLASLYRPPATARQKIDSEGDQTSACNNANDDYAVVFQEVRHPLAIKNCQRALRVIAQRARHENRQQKAPARKLQSAGRGHKNLEWHRGRQ